MQSHHRSFTCSIVITGIVVVAAVLATVSATLGAPVGAIVLGEVSGLACLTAFTLLIWAAIQDGKQPDRTVVGAD
jgi:hypothetical protein